MSSYSYWHSNYTSQLLPSTPTPLTSYLPEDLRQPISPTILKTVTSSNTPISPSTRKRKMCKDYDSLINYGSLLNDQKIRQLRLKMTEHRKTKAREIDNSQKKRSRKEALGLADPTMLAAIDGTFDFTIPNGFTVQDVIKNTVSSLEMVLIFLLEKTIYILGKMLLI